MCTRAERAFSRYDVDLHPINCKQLQYAFTTNDISVCVCTCEWWKWDVWGWVGLDEWCTTFVLCTVYAWSQMCEADAIREQQLLVIIHVSKILNNSTWQGYQTYGCIHHQHKCNSTYITVQGISTTEQNSSAMTSFVMLYIIIKLSTHTGFQVQEMIV